MPKDSNGRVTHPNGVRAEVACLGIVVKMPLPVRFRGIALTPRAMHEGDREPKRVEVRPHELTPACARGLGRSDP